MEKTWKPTVAGILNIVAGVFGLFGVFGVIIAIIAVGSASYVAAAIPFLDPSMAPSFVQTVLIIVAVILIILTVLPLIGGIYAIQRKKLGLALTGSVFAIFGSVFFGIAATILLALARDEFE
jgi:hypothetical protein